MTTIWVPYDMINIFRDVMKELLNNPIGLRKLEMPLLSKVQHLAWI